MRVYTQLRIHRKEPDSADKHYKDYGGIMQVFPQVKKESICILEISLYNENQQHESKGGINFMKYRQTVNICQLDKFICKRDKKDYSLEEVMPLIEKHIKREIDHTFPLKAFRKWYNGDSEIHFGWNSIKYVWDCNETKEEK